MGYENMCLAKKIRLAYMRGLNNLLIDYPLLHIFGILMEFSIVPSGSKWYTVWSISFSLGKYGI